MAEASALAKALASGDVNAALPEAYQDPNTGPGAKIARMIQGLVTLPQRAIENSQYSLDSGTYDPKVPLEAALMLTGGAGGFPAEANSLRAGIRTYDRVPDSLMGFRKSGPQKAFDESAYPHVQDVEVTLPETSLAPRETFRDQIRGMNADHALERAYRNWPDALHITPVPPQ